MKNYNDIVGQQTDISRLVELVYSKGYDKAYNDRKIEEEFDEDREKAIKEAYQKGLDDAWGCAKKIALTASDGGFSIAQLRIIFDEGFVADIVSKYSASEAIAKIKEYEEKKKADEEIKVGDEIANTNGYTAIVTYIHDEKCIDIMWHDGSCGRFLPRKSFEKTGRHFDIQNILDQMKDEQ